MITELVLRYVENRTRKVKKETVMYVYEQINQLERLHRMPYAT